MTTDEGSCPNPSLPSGHMRLLPLFKITYNNAVMKYERVVDTELCCNYEVANLGKAMLHMHLFLFSALPLPDYPWEWCTPGSSQYWVTCNNSHPPKYQQSVFEYPIADPWHCHIRAWLSLVSPVF